MTITDCRAPNEGAPVMVRPRVFISFQMEDRWARDFLKEHARGSDNEIQFIDYSVQDPFDNSWKTQCKLRIAQTQGTIVLIGPTTYRSEAVEWEIRETIDQGHHIFGIQIDSDETHRIPNGLPASNVIRWNFSAIAGQLSSWV
ncbi:TIR domain-containing protein [Streptomyces sp. NPDC058794]|uniref:TIR domain-containing protein n=1 Tax=unclassified Streptomyces TaxID=2593676 RepID=UPI0036A1BA43